jgi:hypothetical protein
MKEILFALAELNNESNYRVRDLLKENIVDFKSIIIPCFPKPEKGVFCTSSKRSRSLKRSFWFPDL